MKLKNLFVIAGLAILLLTGCSDDTERNPDAIQTAPATPVNFHIEAGDQNVVITWDASDAAEFYTLYWSNNEGQASSGQAINNVTSPYTHSGLTNGQPYYYVITASNSHGQSSVSNELMALPAAVAQLPPIPSISQTVTGDQQVTLYWNAIAGADSYSLYWSNIDGDGINGTKIENVSSPYIHSALQNGNTYYYVLTANNSVGESQPSTQVAAVPNPPPPVPIAPTISGVTPVVNGLVLEWPDVADATSYTIFWGNSPGNHSGGSLYNVQSPYTFVTPDSSRTYYIVLVAVNSGGNSLPSAEVSGQPLALPNAPGLVKTSNGNSMVTISWAASATLNYNLYWSTTEGLGKRGTMISNVTSPFTHTGLQNDLKYFYVVTAVNENGEGDASAQVYGLPNLGAEIPAVPTHVTAVAGDKTIVLNWTPVSGAQSYSIYRSQSAGAGTTGTLTSYAQPPYQVNGLSNGVDYYFTVIANNAVGSSGLSQEVTTAPAIQLIPNALSHEVELTWNVTNGATYNLVYASTSGVTPDNYTGYSDGVLAQGIVPPYTVSGLSNGQMYYFMLEEVGSSILRSAETVARPNTLSVYGKVNDSVTNSSGRTYLAGNFTRLGATLGGAVLFERLGSQARRLAFPYVQGVVHSSAVDGNGGWYIGGKFNQVGGLSRQNIAHILADGSVDTNWGPPVNDIVTSMLYDNGQLYIGGQFTEVDTNPRIGLAAFTATGALSNWKPEVSGTINTMFMHDSILYIGGLFSQVNGVTRNNVAAISASGVLTSWAPDVNDYVNQLVISGSTVYLAGNFSMINQQPRSSKAIIDTNGELGDNNEIYRNGQVYAVVVNGDGSVSWGSDYTSTYGTAVQVMVSSDSGLYLGGGGFSPVFSISRFSNSRQNWKPEFPHDIASAGAQNFAPKTMSVQDNRILIGGKLGILSGTERLALAAIEADGSLGTWNPVVESSQNSGPGTVNTLALHGDNLYFGGSFGAVGGELRFSLAAVGGDGTLLPWDPRSGIISISPDGSQIIVTRAGGVQDMEINGDTVYIGGTFSYISGLERNSLAAIAIDGTLLDWNPDIRNQAGYAVSNQVYDIAFDGNILYFVGNFGSVGGLSGVERNYVAAIDTAGVLQNWYPTVNNLVRTVTTDAGTVYLGGQFSSVNGESRMHLASINANGGLNPWNPSLTGNVNGFADVTSMLANNGVVYVGGWFQSTNGLARQNLAAIASDATLLNWNPGTDDWVWSMTNAGTDIVVTGNFSQIGNKPISGIAKIGQNGIVLE